MKRVQKLLTFLSVGFPIIVRVIALGGVLHSPNLLHQNEQIKTIGDEAECKTAEDVAELPQQQSRNATWQMMNHSSYSSSPSSSSAFSPHTTTIINNNNQHLIIPCSTSSVTSPTITIDHHPTNPQLDHPVNFFTKPYTSYNLNNHQYHHHMSELEDSQTLQLFPLECGLGDHYDQEEEEDDEVEDREDIGDDHNDHVTPPNYQFFEFLPLKN